MYTQLEAETSCVTIIIILVYINFYGLTILDSQFSYVLVSTYEVMTIS